MATFEITPVVTERNELKFSGLYMYHIPSGPNRNQESLVSKNGLGSLVANNWVVRDGPNPNAKVIARAQGMHMNTGVNQTWQNFLCLTFEDDRYYL